MNCNVILDIAKCLFKQKIQFHSLYNGCQIVVVNKHRLGCTNNLTVDGSAICNCKFKVASS